MADSADSSLRALQDTKQRFELGAELLRARLKFFFGRRCTRSDEVDDLQDCIQETLIRVMRRVEAGEEIFNLEACAVETAKFVHLEFLHRKSSERARTQPVMDGVDPLDRVVDKPVDPHIEQRANCVNKCLQTLKDSERSLITSWYAEPTGGAKVAQHRLLTEKEDVPASTLRVRVFRLVNKLRKCSEECIEREGSSRFTPISGSDLTPILGSRTETKRLG
jgi:DNA-directed RNA polymerase specialized sigma24 family protein